MTTIVSATDLATSRRRSGDELQVIGRGRVRGADLTGLRFVQLIIKQQRRPGVTARHLRSLTFEDCDFSGLRTTWFDPDGAEFLRCKFSDVRIKASLLKAAFRDCSFSGTVEANFSAKGVFGTAQSRISGNDFRRASGMAFFDGVAANANMFDLGGRHLILRRDRECWKAALALVEDGHPWLAAKLSSLRGEGPIGYNQDWVLLYRDAFTEQEWDQLCADRHDPGPPTATQRLRRRARGWRGIPLEDHVDDLTVAEDPGSTGRISFDHGVVFTIAPSPEEAATLYRNGSPTAVVPTSLDIFQVAELQARISGQSVDTVVADMDKASTDHDGVVVFAILTTVGSQLAMASEDQLHAWSRAYPSPESPVPSSGGPWNDDAIRLALSELRRLSLRALNHGLEIFATMPR